MIARHLKKYYFILILLMISVLLTGCLEIDYFINVNDDGTKRVVLKIKYSMLAEPYLSDIQKEIKENGYHVSETYDIDDDKFDKIIIAEKTFARDELIKEKMYLHSKDYILFTKWTLDYTENMQDYEAEDFEYSVPIRFNINLPGIILESNAQKTVDGNLFWEYYLNSPEMNIHAESVKINYFLSVVIVSGIVIVFLLTFWIIKNKRS